MDIDTIDSANYTLESALGQTEAPAENQPASDEPQTTDDGQAGEQTTAEEPTQDPAEEPTQDPAEEPGEEPVNDEQADGAEPDIEALLAKPVVAADPELVAAIEHYNRREERFRPVEGYVTAFETSERYVPAAVELVAKLAAVHGSTPEDALKRLIADSELVLDALGTGADPIKALYNRDAEPRRAPAAAPAPAAAQLIEEVLAGLRDDDVADATVDALGKLLNGQAAEITRMAAQLEQATAASKRAAEAQAAQAREDERRARLQKQLPGIAKAIAADADGFVVTSAMLEDAARSYPVQYSKDPTGAVYARYAKQIAAHRAAAGAAAGQKPKAAPPQVATGSGGSTDGKAIDSRGYSLEDAIRKSQLATAG